MQTCLAQASGYDSGSFGMLLKHFWHRLLGTCLCWFCNDFMFYGNATFRTVFIGYASYSVSVMHSMQSSLHLQHQDSFV